MTSVGSVLEEFKVGDAVFWGSQSSGSYRRKVGVVVAVVESGERPVPPEGLKCNSAAGYGMRRDHRSYLVQVGNKKGVYWPRVKHLGRVVYPQNTEDQRRRASDMTTPQDNAEPSVASPGSVDAKETAMNFVDEPYGWGLVFDGRSGSLHDSAGEAKDYAINYADDVSYRAFPLYERAWISADDRLPPNDEYVACLTMSGRPIAARYDAAGWWTVFCTTPYSMATITHWMPLPAPPSDGK